MYVLEGKTRNEYCTEEEQKNMVKRKAHGMHFEGIKVVLIELSLVESNIWLKKLNCRKQNIHTR